MNYSEKINIVVHEILILRTNRKFRNIFKHVQGTDLQILKDTVYELITVYMNTTQNIIMIIFLQ